MKVNRSILLRYLVAMCALLVLALGQTVSAGPVSRYTFDTDANDATGFRDGVLIGDASITVNSKVGSGAVELDGGYVDLPGGYPSLNGLSRFTMTAWLNLDEGPGLTAIFAVDMWGTTALHFNYVTQLGSAVGGVVPEIQASFGGMPVYTADIPATPNTGWFHIALVHDAKGETVLYVDGVMKHNDIVPNLTNLGNDVAIGSWNGGRLFDGRIDDFRIYYDDILSEFDIGCIADPNCKRAINPSPFNNETDVDPNVVLTWDASGEVTNPTYDVYLNDSNSLTTPVAMGLTAMSFDPEPDLENTIATTYYWRVDVIEDGTTTITGNVWNFTTSGPECDPPLDGDVTGDCLVNLQDFAVMANDWLKCTLVPQSNCP